MTLRSAAFDLDDTLFLEHAYVLSGFTAVANAIAPTYAMEPGEIVRELIGIEAGGHQGQVFDTWLQRRTHPTAGPTVDDLLAMYRSHRPNISFFPGVLNMLLALRRAAYRLAIVSDGPVESQRAKVEALGLERLVDRIVLTDEWGLEFWKPHQRAFEVLESDWSCSPSETVYVGDNPQKDFAGPNLRGWLTIRVRLKGQRLYSIEPLDSDVSPGVEFGSVDELCAFLLAQAPL